MKIIHPQRLWLSAGLLALSTLGQAQSPVRDSDNEARNAYQESCTTTQKISGFAFCTQPALSSGKQLAIRYVSATCRESSATRNVSVMFMGRIGSVTSASNGPILIPVRTNSARQPFYLLAQLVFLHTDSLPFCSLLTGSLFDSNTAPFRTRHLPCIDGTSV